MIRWSDYAAMRVVVLGVALLLATTTTAQQSPEPSPGAVPSQAAVYRVGGDVSAPRVTLNVPPVYPDEARKQRLEGKVMLYLVVNADGTPRDVRVARSLGHGFDEAAVAAVKQWRFEPAKKNGEPVAAQANVEIKFQLAAPNSATGSTPQPSSPADLESQMRALLGVSMELPVGWVLAGKQEPSFSRPAAMAFRLGQTPAVLTLAHQMMEASPELYVKMAQQSFSVSGAEYHPQSAASIQRNGWDGTRLSGTLTSNEITYRVIAEIFSRDKEHYTIAIVAPDEIYLRHADEFVKILASVRLEGLPAAALQPAPTTSTVTTGTAATTPAAEQAYQSGLQAENREDFRAALDHFRQAVELAPAHGMAWNELGRVYLRMGRYDDAIAAFKKQIEINPRHQFAYNSLGLTLAAQGKTGEAEAAYRQQIAVHPDDRYAHTNLGLLLVRKRNYAAAVPELEAAARYDPLNTSAKTFLGMAYLRTGQKEKGLSVLDEAARGSSDPTVLNNVAYYLAQQGGELERARQYAESALAIINPLLRNLDLGHIASADVRHMIALATYWDTLGWIHYKSGNLPAAERYLRAAWELSHSPVDGAHLAELLEKRGSKDEASRFYADAIARQEQLRQTPEPEEVEQARKRLDALTGSTDAAKSRVEAASAAIKSAVKLARSSTTSGEADYFVLIGRGTKIEDIRFVSGPIELSGLESSLKALPYTVSLPDDNAVKLLLRLKVSCEAGRSCAATMYDIQHTANLPLPEFATAGR